MIFKIQMNNNLEHTSLILDSISPSYSSCFTPYPAPYLAHSIFKFSSPSPPPHNYQPHPNPHHPLPPTTSLIYISYPFLIPSLNFHPNHILRTNNFIPILIPYNLDPLPHLHLITITLTYLFQIFQLQSSKIA